MATQKLKLSMKGRRRQGHVLSERVPTSSRASKSRQQRVEAVDDFLAVHSSILLRSSHLRTKELWSSTSAAQTTCTAAALSHHSYACHEAHHRRQLERPKKKKAKKAIAVFKPKDPNFSFFTLPTKLPNRVYEQVVSYKTRHVLVPCKDPSAFRGCPRRRLRDPQIARTCRRAREEALAIYYRYNRFAILVKDFDFDPLSRLIKGLASNLLSNTTDLYIIYQKDIPIPRSCRYTEVQLSARRSALNFQMEVSLTKACEMTQYLQQRGVQWQCSRKLAR